MPKRITERNSFVVILVQMESLPDSKRGQDGPDVCLRTSSLRDLLFEASFHSRKPKSTEINFLFGVSRLKPFCETGKVLLVN